MPTPIFTQKIRIDWTEKDFAVIASEDIPTGTMVLFEHVFASTSLDFIVDSIMLNKALFNILHPREESYDDLARKNVFELLDRAFIKLSYNTFKFGDEYVLGHYFSKFNHACNPNCFMTNGSTLKKINKENGNIPFLLKTYVMYTMRPIKKGEELTINYLNDRNGKHGDLKSLHNFKCSCTPEDIIRHQYKNAIRTKISLEYKTRDLDFMHNELVKYMKTDIGTETAMFQFMIENKYF